MPAIYLFLISSKFTVLDYAVKVDILYCLTLEFKYIRIKYINNNWPL